MVGGLLLYMATLAPTVIWGDDATLQLAAVKGTLEASAGSHPAWVVLAHLLTKLPVGDLAYRVNLLSAFAGATTLGILFLILRALPLSRSASILATLAFGVSHTFWAHAVRAEVYTLTLTTMGLMVVTVLYWRNTGQERYLALLGVAIGLAFTTHLLAVLYLPALAWLLLTHRQQLTRRGLVSLIACTLVTLLPLAFLLWRDAQQMQMSLSDTLHWALFTFQGYDFQGRVLRFSVISLASDAVQWLVFLGYQFFGLALPLGIAGAASSRRHIGRKAAVFLVLLYLIPAAFAFSYQVGDRYVFFLPSYLAFSIWLGIGLDTLFNARPMCRVSAPWLIGLTLLLVALPVTTYRLTPDIMAHFGLEFREGRKVPGAGSRYFLLWPPKTGYYDTRIYAEAALASAPVGALLLADPVLATPMQYLQGAENVRTDVTVRFCCWDMESALTDNTGRPIALADLAPEVYPVSQLRGKYDIVMRPPIYLLTPLDK